MTRENFFENLRTNYKSSNLDEKFKNEFFESDMNAMNVYFKVLHNMESSTYTIELVDVYTNSRGNEFHKSYFVTMYENFNASGDKIEGYDFESALKVIATWMEKGLVLPMFTNPCVNDDELEE